MARRQDDTHHWLQYFAYELRHPVVTSMPSWLEDNAHVLREIYDAVKAQFHDYPIFDQGSFADFCMLVSVFSSCSGMEKQRRKQILRHWQSTRQDQRLARSRRVRSRSQSTHAQKKETTDTPAPPKSAWNT